MFKSNLRSARIAKGLSQRELAEKLHITQQAYSRYESGQSSPSMDTLNAISTALDVSADALLGLPENKKEPAPTDGDGLDPLDQRLVSLLPKLSQGQKKLLLTQLELTIQDDPE